jgi:hypothetical protein
VHDEHAALDVERRVLVSPRRRDGFARDAYRNRAKRAQMRGERAPAGEPVFLVPAETG